MKTFQASILFVGMATTARASSSLRGLQNQSEPGEIPVQFDRFCGTEFCAFRVMAEIGGMTVLVDSGSSSLGFCSMYDEQDVTNVRAATTSSGEQVSQCALYGGGEVYAHGWTGPSYIGNIKGPNGEVLEDVLFSTMKYKVGVNGNACGKAATSSAGVSQSLGGIWGIAGQQLNSAGIMTTALYDTWKDVPSNSECNMLEGQCQCPSSSDEVMVPDSLLSTIARNAGSENGDQWGLSWDGNLGPNTGKMYFGEYANLPASSQYANTFVPITMNGFYGFQIESVLVNNEAIDLAPFNTIFDTGTPSLVLPEQVASAAHAAVTAEGVAVTLVLKTTTGESFPIQMKFTPEILHSDVQSTSGSETIIGLPLMRYIEYIKMNFAEQTMQVVPRDETNFILTPNLN